MATNSTSNVFATPEAARAKHLKDQRDAYTRVGFTINEAMRLLEAEVSAQSLPPQVVNDPPPKRLPPFELPNVMPALQPPFKFTCDHKDVIAALVENAGGFAANSAGQLILSNAVVRNA